ncbi:MAG: hypothetical protein LBD20_01235, partial [Spirochaetaceae bacterium]|nr:hypothetical protein [Spirochaetaceae bacterium]
MAKITDSEQQRRYAELIKPHETAIKDFLKREAETLNECRKDPKTAASRLFSLAGSELDITSKYLVINGISHTVLGIRSEDALGEARKSLSKAIIYIENIVTGKPDALFSEYEEFLNELQDVSSERKLYFIRKMGFTIDLIKLSYGENTKWKWAFVDFEGRFAVITKNLLDLRKAQTNDFDKPDYEFIANHIKLAKSLLNKSANRFLERFELSTRSIDDLRFAVG